VFWKLHAKLKWTVVVNCRRQWPSPASSLRIQSRSHVSSRSSSEGPRRLDHQPLNDEKALREFVPPLRLSRKASPKLWSVFDPQNGVDIEWYLHTESYLGEINEKPYIIVLQVENAFLDLFPKSNLVHYRKAFHCQWFVKRSCSRRDRQTDGRTDGLENRQSDLGHRSRIRILRIFFIRKI